tara:strand:- start:3807 stop:4508 length:702 start_codon:yes stop_codon:yes gene_type:complete
VKLIFDIGFNVGKFTLKCNELHPEAKIVGVEANINLFYGLKNKGFKKLTLINKLVSDVDNEKKTLFIDPQQPGISTALEAYTKDSRFKKGSKYLRENNSNWSSKEEVSSITMDTMIKKYGKPDLVKIDVEGYEYNVLKGLTEKVGKICFECHEEEKDKLYLCIEHLQKLGYEEFGFIGYLDEGDKYDLLTYSELGDPYLEEPKKYSDWRSLENEIEQSFIEDRRVNYGMFWSK